MKYQLPVVEHLKKIGFKFEFETINDFFKYAQEFVQDHDAELFKLFIPQFDQDEYEETIELEDCPYFLVIDAERRIERLKNGILEKSDYRFVVHPVHKNNFKVLIRAWEKRKQKFGLDSHVKLYYPKVFGLSAEEAIQQTLLNELYRHIIHKLSQNSFKPISDDNSHYREQIENLWDRFMPSKYPVGSVQYKFRMSVIAHNTEKIKDSQYEELFSKPMTVEEKASKLFYRIIGNFQFNEIYQTTSLIEKEMVIRYFLKLQSSNVQKAKNTRGRGLHAAKKNKIIQYFADNPNANISQAAQSLGFSRNTVRKYQPKK